MQRKKERNNILNVNLKILYARGDIHVDLFTLYDKPFGAAYIPIIC